MSTPGGPMVYKACMDLLYRFVLLQRNIILNSECDYELESCIIAYSFVQFDSRADEGFRCISFDQSSGWLDATWRKVSWNTGGSMSINWHWHQRSRGDCSPRSDIMALDYLWIIDMLARICKSVQKYNFHSVIANLPLISDIEHQY